MSRSLIIGMGEVGRAVYEVIDSAKYPVQGIDKGTKAEGKFDILHICIPYISDFIGVVNEYANEYLDIGGLIIIHSTVPVGTTEQIPNAVHSPIRGVHPKLAEGIKTFKKYFGGDRAEDAANFFLPLVSGVAWTKDSRNTEALKLWDTTQYGWQIVLEKMIHQYCEREGLDFEFVYRDANESYNKGYAKLNRPEVVRPYLKHIPGKIGGHCVMQNLELLDHPISSYLKMENGTYE